jgi:subtilisin family serine protease
MDKSNVGLSIGRHGLGGPGDGVTSLAPNRKPVVKGGTSAAAPFVSGAAALLWSLFPGASAIDVRWALTRSGNGARSSIVPPLLNAWQAYQELKAA